MLVKFTKDEIKHLLISFILVSIFSAVHMTYKLQWSTDEFIVVLLLTFIVFIISLILRTYVQKKVALNYRFTVNYKLYSYGIIFSLVTIIFNIIVLVPGYIDYGLYDRMINDEEKYKIASTAPKYNIILAIIFMIMVIILKLNTSLPVMNLNGILLLFALIGFNINSYMAFFNLIPFMVTDGLNMINHKTLQWIILIIISVILTVISFLNILL